MVLQSLEPEAKFRKNNFCLHSHHLGLQAVVVMLTIGARGSEALRYLKYEVASKNSTWNVVYYLMYDKSTGLHV